MDLDPWQYIVLVGAIIMVGAFIMPRNKKEAAPSSPSVQNMEAALEQFMDNMDKENRELVHLVANAQKAAHHDAELKEQRIAALELKYNELAKQYETLLNHSASTVPIVTQAVIENHVQQEMNTAEPAPEADHSIQHRYSELFQLHDQGKSIEAIAKKLGMNKGEVQLIIQLAKQEETVRV